MFGAYLLDGIVNAQGAHPECMENLAVRAKQVDSVIGHTVTPGDGISLIFQFFESLGRHASEKSAENK